MNQPTPDPPARSFLPLLRAAVTARPERLDLLRDLVVALRDDRQWPEIFDLLLPLVGAGKLTPVLACELARAAIACDQPALALQVLGPVATEAAPETRRQRIFALYALNRTEEAHIAAVQVLNENPSDITLLQTFADDCLRRGDVEVLATVCRQAINNGNGSATHFAYFANALSLSGHMSDTLRLLDPERMCRRVELDSAQVDNEELVQAILAHPALAASPESRATRGHNLRLEALASVDHPAIRNLLATIRREVDDYLAEPFNAAHPIIAHRPRAAWLQGWALVLSNDGHEETHIHPQGWLSVIYYARVPKAVLRRAEDNMPQPGSLAFGPWPPSIAETLADFPRWTLAPQDGTLLIFPSFFGHGTIPTGVDDPRICIALDVLPCE